MLVLKNGNVMTMAGPAFVGDVAIENGKIVAVGQNLSYSDAEVRDVTGMTVMPGIVDPHCHIGMWEDAMGFEGAGGYECTNPIRDHLRDRPRQRERYRRTVRGDKDVWRQCR